MLIPVAEALFSPRGIAIIGASNDPAKLSGRPLDYLLRLGYRGGIYPVNPNRPQVQGVSAYRAVRDARGPVDLAIVVVPAAAVPQALIDCAAAGLSVAIVFASGFAEIGGKGGELQSEVERIARTTGLRVLGPNGLGAFSLPSGAFATFSSAFDQHGELPNDPIALVSQSGAVGTFIFTTMLSMGVGVRYFANTGNEADVAVGELLCALAKADDIDVLIGHLEDAKRFPVLADAAATARRFGKPMILLKAGVTAAGARAVRLHTGSDAGSEEAFAALVSRYGVIRVESMEDAADAAVVFRGRRRAGGRRLAIITQSGGAAALATDAAVQAGLEVNELRAELQVALRRMLPEYGSTANPIDLTGVLLTDPPLLDRVLSRVISDPDIDMILTVLGNSDRGAEEIVRGLLAGFRATTKPFVVAWSGGSGRPRQRLLELEIATYPDPHRAVRALRHVADFSFRG